MIACFELPQLDLHFQNGMLVLQYSLINSGEMLKIQDTQAPPKKKLHTESTNCNTELVSLSLDDGYFQFETMYLLYMEIHVFSILARKQ